MRRKHVNFKKSAKKFAHSAKRIHVKNTPSYKPARGGGRL